MEIEGTFVSNNLDETVSFRFEKREEWALETKGERLHGITVDTSSAPRLANSSAALFPKINECPETQCTLIVQEDRKGSSCQICQRG